MLWAVENIQTLKLDAFYSILVDQFDHLFSMLLNNNCSGLKKKYRQIIFMSKYKREKSQIIEIEEEISILVKKKSAIGVSIYNQWNFFGVYL